MSDIAGGTMIESNGGFAIGDVLGRVFSLLGRNFVPFIVISAIAALPYIAFNWGIAKPQLGAPGGVFTRMLISFGIGGFMQLLTQAVIVHAAFQDMAGRPIRIGQSLGVGLSRFLPILGLMILMGLGVGFASLLLLVPGLILLVMWYVALPACVVESLGPIESFRRSAELTKGHRWKLFGLLVLIWIVSFVIGLVVRGLGMSLGGAIGFVVLQFVVQAVVGAFEAILVIVVYRDLRVAKEGIGTEQIAAVFD